MRIIIDYNFWLFLRTIFFSKFAYYVNVLRNLRLNKENSKLEINKSIIIAFNNDNNIDNKNTDNDAI